MNAMEDVLRWLREGSDEAEDIVDLPWDVRKVDESTYVAEHPKVPFLLVLSFSENFIRLMVPLNLETLGMDSIERMKIYHALLRLNGTVNLMKFALIGMNDDVYLISDLDSKSLSKEEFNDALTALLIGLRAAVKVLKLEAEFARTLYSRIVGMVVERLQKGASEEDILKFLVTRVGLSKEDAENLLREIGIRKEKKEDSLMYG